MCVHVCFLLFKSSNQYFTYNNKLNKLQVNIKTFEPWESLKNEEAKKRRKNIKMEGNMEDKKGEGGVGGGGGGGGNQPSPGVNH